MQITLALIGLAGTLGAALFANWDAIFPARRVEPLSITAPADVQQVAAGSRTMVSLGEPRHSGGEGRRAVANDAPASGFTVGRHVVTWTVTDEANQASRDSQQVVITAPSAPTCQAELLSVPSRRVVTSGADAQVVRGDGEIDSDDWTRVEISYAVRVEPSYIDVDVTWYSQELNRDKSRGDTRIQSRKTVRLYTVPTRCNRSRILDTRRLTRRASGSMDFRGEQHDLNRFGRSVGNLDDIRVRFDGPGGTDDRRQLLEAEFEGFQVRISETP